MKLFDAVTTSRSDYIPGNGIVNVKMNVKGFISSRYLEVSTRVNENVSRVTESQ